LNGRLKKSRIMSEDLNKRYFEARKEHEKASSKKGYAIWILVLVFFLSILIGFQVFNNRTLRLKREKQEMEFFERGAVSTKDTLIYSQLTGTRILVPANSFFKESDNNFSFLKNDSSALKWRY
jgi:hypothetical protein